MSLLARAGYRLREKHWTQAGLAHIAEGNDPESHPHNAVFEAPQGHERPNRGSPP
jgi:hypothetical protein